MLGFPAGVYTPDAFACDRCRKLFETSYMSHIRWGWCLKCWDEVRLKLRSGGRLADSDWNHND